MSSASARRNGDNKQANEGHYVQFHNFKSFLFPLKSSSRDSDTLYH
jgi:hypothetical protein